MRLAQRLLLGSLAVVSVLVGLVVIIASRRLQTRLVEEQAFQLAREAQVVASQWAAGDDADALADAAGAALGHRVTLIAMDGRVVGDSDFDGPALQRLENLGTRPEVRAALRDSVGSARRASAGTGDDLLYVAVRAPDGVARLALRTDRIAAIARGVRRDMLVAGLVALAVVMTLASWFARSITAPIVELRDVARGLAGGDLSRRPTLSAPGEVGDLATALHRMADQLAFRLEALEAEDALLAALIESLNEGVIAVDRRRRVVRINDSGRRLLEVHDPLPFPVEHLPRERALHDALDASLDGEPTLPAEIRIDDRTLALTARPLADGGAVLALFDLTPIRRLESVRRDFVANVSHELKTPLTVISGFAETLAEEDVPAAQRRQFVEAVRANTGRMQRIVDDLLDLSRIESGRWAPNPVAVDIAGAAREAMAGVDAMAQAKGVRTSLELGDDATTVVADPTALRQVLTNLVENAVRYTGAGGSVIIRTRRDDSSAGIWLEVRDTGIGIPTDHLPRIFERFYRVDPGRSREVGGTGLGLAIVRHLAEAHGGTTRAESSVGRGTTIGVFFPSSPPSTPLTALR